MAEYGSSGKPSLEEDEVVILVPRGQRDRIHVEEQDLEEANSQITVRVSRQRKSQSIPVLGVIVK